MYDDLMKQGKDEIQKPRFCQKVNQCETPVFLRKKSIPMDLKSIAKEINSRNVSWKADEDSKQNGMSEEDVKKTMGTIVDPDFLMKLPVKTHPGFVAPTNFDARQQWPNCKSIGTIRDQANCGSCWAFGTTEAFNDRHCIKNYNGKGPELPLFSAADTAGCCNGFLSCGGSNDCNGGQIGAPWDWFHRTGVVSGGGYGDKTTCYPQTMPECAHHVASSTLKNCEDVPRIAPTCSKSCVDTEDQESSKIKASSGQAYTLTSANDVKAELVQNGSVTMAFTVQSDFLTQKSGVQSHQTGSALGGHATKIIGQGNQDGQDYWLVNNSWNNTWGDNGTFKIAMSEVSQFSAGDV